jgi:hypothetical protein
MIRREIERRTYRSWQTWLGTSLFVIAAAISVLVGYFRWVDWQGFVILCVTTEALACGSYIAILVSVTERHREVVWRTHGNLYILRLRSSRDA